MTGDTENGRSISVIRNCLPRKSNFAIAQAAATPKIVLTGTTIAAVVSVSRIAASVSGVCSASRYTREPLRERVAEHRHDGHDKNVARNNTERKISTTRAIAALRPSRERRYRGLCISASPPCGECASR